MENLLRLVRSFDLASSSNQDALGLNAHQVSTELGRLRASCSEQQLTTSQWNTLSSTPGRRTNSEAHIIDTLCGTSMSAPQTPTGHLPTTPDACSNCESIRSTRSAQRSTSNSASLLSRSRVRQLFKNLRQNMQQYAPNQRKNEPSREAVTDVSNTLIDACSNHHSHQGTNNRLATIEESLLSPRTPTTDADGATPAIATARRLNWTATDCTPIADHRRTSRSNSLTASPDSDRTSITSASSSSIRLKPDQRAQSAAELSCASTSSLKSTGKSRASLLAPDHHCDSTELNANQARCIISPICDLLFDLLHYLLLKHRVDLTQPPFTRSVRFCNSFNSVFFTLLFLFRLLCSSLFVRSN